MVFEGHPTEAQIKEATGKMSNYVQALVSNLDDHFKEAAPLLAAFSISTLAFFQINPTRVLRTMEMRS
jgi:hypothetical protein